MSAYRKIGIAEPLHVLVVDLYSQLPNKWGREQSEFDKQLQIIIRRQNEQKQVIVEHSIKLYAEAHNIALKSVCE